MQSNKRYISVSDLEDKLYEHIWYVVFEGSIEQTINRWLRPILDIMNTNREFVSVGELEYRSWYVDKDLILNALHSNVPSSANAEYQNQISETLNDIWDYILDYEVEV